MVRDITGANNPYFKPLTPEQYKIWKLLQEDKLPLAKGTLGFERFKGKKWSELDNVARLNFRHQMVPYYTELLKKTKGMLTETELAKLLSEKFGEEVSIAQLRGRGGGEATVRRGKKFSSKFGQELERLLKPYDFSQKQKFFKKPTDREIETLKKSFLERRSSSGYLKTATAENAFKLHKTFGDVYKTGKLPPITEVLEKFPEMTPSKAGLATTRLAQLYGGSDFKYFSQLDPKLSKQLNNIRLNKNVANKMFKVIEQSKWGDPYHHSFYKLSLDIIDDKLGNKTGTMADLKRQASNILKNNKIAVYDSRAKKPFGFNINEIVGLTGSGKSKAAEFSQFIDVMEGNLNQNVLTGYQSQLSKARTRIENNPKLLETEAKRMNTLASELEKTHNVKLARLRDPADMGKYWSSKRLAELGEQGLDIEKASKRAGYTFQFPKGAQTITEFVKEPKNLINNIKSAVKGLSKKEQLAYCSILSRGGLPGNCAAAIDANPVKTAEIFAGSEATTGALQKVKTASTRFLSLLGRGGVRAAPLAALAAVGAGIEPLVKQFVATDPDTYLTNENQMKGMLLATIEGETPKVDEEILKWQYPGIAAGAATAVPGSKALYKARTSGIGKAAMGAPRAALGPVGKVLAGTFSPLAVAATLPLKIAAQRAGGTDYGDIATDPTNWMGPAFAASGAEWATKGMKNNPRLANAIRLGFSPRTLQVFARRFGIPGLAVSAGMWGYDKWKNRSINDE